MLRSIVLILTVFLAACTTDGSQGKNQSAGAPDAPTPQVAMKTFAAVTPNRAVQRSNRDIAAEFIDLSFFLESGRPVQKFTRFEGPITVGFTKTPPRSAKADLSKLVSRLRTEAGVPISLVADGRPASISIDLVNAKRMRAFVPSAACFIVPNVSSFQEVLQKRRDVSTDWSQLRTRTKAVVVIPDTAPPQEMRDCLHEEIAQALGPLNDLYRLADSVYNDDNFHLVLTPFDMLVLRTFYSAELTSGMRKDQVVARLPALLAKLNPAGQNRASTNQARTSRAWMEAIQGAVGPSGSTLRRTRRIYDTLQLTEKLGYRRNRLGYVLYARGRILSRHAQEDAIDSYARAYQLFRNLYGDEDIHTARATVQLASQAIADGFPNRALSIITPSKKAARKAQDAGLLMNLLALEAATADMTGRPQAAQALRNEARGWGQYALGNARGVEEILKITRQIGRVGQQNLEFRG